MKWQHKGHEFDEIGDKFKHNKKLIFIGDGFEQTNYYVNKPIKDFYNFLDAEIEFIKFPEFLPKWLLLFFALKHNLKRQNAIIIMHYHYSKGKKAWKAANFLRKILRGKLVFDTNGFFERFLSVYSAYVRDKVYVRDTCVIVTTVCTLNCKYCLNFTPFIQNASPVKIEKLKEEADVYFKSVDKVGFFQISGGEPLSYQYLADYIEWLSNTYGEKIGQILLATNGTLIPNERLTEVLRKYKIVLLLDNYTQAVPRVLQTRNKLIEHLKNNGIDYRNYEDKQEFFKFFPAAEDYSKWSDEQLAKRAEKCWGVQPCRNLRNGRIYYCNFSSFAVTAGIM